MRFAGRVFRSGEHWAVEVPMLGVVSQGQTRKLALEMITDAVECLANEPGFEVQVYPGPREYFEIGASDDAVLTALLLRRERTRSGLTLAEAARRLGARSTDAYARYEKGKSVPSIAKLTELLAAVAPHKDFVLAKSLM